MTDRQTSSAKYAGFDSILDALEGFADKCVDEPNCLTDREMIAFGLLLRETPEEQGVAGEGGLSQPPQEASGGSAESQVQNVLARRWSLLAWGIGLAASVFILIGFVVVGAIERSKTQDERNASGGEERDPEFDRQANLVDLDDSAKQDSTDSGASPTREQFEPTTLEKLESKVVEKEDELAKTFLADYGAMMNLDVSPRSDDGRLFLKIVESQVVSEEVRGVAAWALRSFEETWEDLGHVLQTDKSADFLLEVIHGIPTNSVHEVPGVVRRALLELVKQGSTHLRRNAASRLAGYLDPDGALGEVGRVCLERVLVEKDQETLNNLFACYALEQALVAASPEFLELVEIAEGIAPGDWNTSVGRRARAGAFRLIEKVDPLRAADLLFELLRTDGLLAKELVLVLLGEPGLLRIPILEHRIETYEVFGQALRNGDVERFWIERALLEADGAGAIAGLKEIAKEELDLRFPMDRLLHCEEGLFSASEYRASLEGYLAERLHQLEGRAGKELSGLCSLLVRIGTETVQATFLEASRRSDVPILVRIQLFLGWLQGDPDLSEAGEAGKELFDGIQRGLTSLDAEESMAVLAGAVPVPLALQNPDTIAALISLIERPPSDFPIFPFLVVPELYRLRALELEIGPDLESFTASFLHHADWRVRLATALARLDGGNGHLDEVSAVVRSAPTQMLFGVEFPSSTRIEEQLDNLRERIVRVRPYGLQRVVTGKIDPETERDRKRRFMSRLQDGLEGVREARRAFTRGVEGILGKGEVQLDVQRKIVDILARVRTEEMRTTIARKRSVITDPELSSAMNTILDLPEAQADRALSKISGTVNLENSRIRASLMGELEESIEDWVVRNRES